mgnify:CR=1 FL=1
MNSKTLRDYLMDNGAAEPVKKSLCGTCNKCTNACPAQAITGNL